MGSARTFLYSTQRIARQEIPRKGRDVPGHRHPGAEERERAHGRFRVEAEQVDPARAAARFTARGTVEGWFAVSRTMSAPKAVGQLPDRFTTSSLLPLTMWSAPSFFAISKRFAS